MRICSKSMVLAALLLVAPPAIGGLKDIHAEKLPQEKAVLKAYADMVTVENFVSEWQEKWSYETPKNEVVSLVKGSLGELQKAAASEPKNEELLLLTGLVAHYAHNVDIDGAYQVAVDSLQKAHGLAPEDYRPEWFLGVHECQAGQIKEGMDRLLSIERVLAWEQLPSRFWDDYLYCADLANLPAHALRAGDRATKLKAQPSRNRDFLIEIARKRFKAPDATATYSSQEVWRAEKRDSRVVFTGSMFGLAFSSHDEWKVNLGDVQKGVCVVVIKTGPHAGKTGDIIPNILILARQPKAGETLSDFLKTLLPHESANPARVAGCPSQECLAFEIVKPDVYQAEGGGYFIVTAFKRDAPEFAGLLFEEPVSLPASESGNAQYFRPTERLHRLDGSLYYLVALDTAASVVEKAKSDYEAFLKDIRVE